MPIISTFYGISIKMRPRGECGTPHFFASYKNYSGVIDIRTLRPIDGDLPSSALYWTREWAAARLSELMDIWETQNFEKVEPLE